MEAVKTYRITPDAYGTKPRRALGWICEFVFLAGLLLLGFVFVDFSFSVHSGTQSAPHALMKNVFEAVFIAGATTLLNLGTHSPCMTFEVRADRITVYDGEALDPLHRRGNTVLRTEVYDVREVRRLAVFAPRPYGLAVRYGPKSWWRAKRFFVPAGAIDYDQLKPELLSWNRGTA